MGGERPELRVEGIAVQNISEILLLLVRSDDMSGVVTRHEDLPSQNGEEPAMTMRVCHTSLTRTTVHDGEGLRVPGLTSASKLTGRVRMMVRPAAIASL